MVTKQPPNRDRRAYLLYRDNSLDRSAKDSKEKELSSKEFGVVAGSSSPLAKSIARTSIPILLRLREQTWAFQRHETLPLKVVTFVGPHSTLTRPPQLNNYNLLQPVAPAAARNLSTASYHSNWHSSVCNLTSHTHTRAEGRCRCLGVEQV